MEERHTLEQYLGRVLGVPVELLAVQPLKGPLGEEGDPKGFGYGAPLEVRCLANGEPRSFVFARTRPECGFGHDYPADLAWQAFWAHSAYNTLPRHVRSLDVGFMRTNGELVPAGDASEFFQLVEKAEGQSYWFDLYHLLTESPSRRDTVRTEALARYLAEIHAVKRDAPWLYHRRIRELVGHGECLMGILDSYPHPYPLLTPHECEALERAAVTWRWRLRDKAHRLSKTHGDFHPWNILFREGADFSVLDRSRGEWGEPADDVAALTINYLFFGLLKENAAESFHRLFVRFFDVYLDETEDRDLFELLPPFYLFRALVIAHPLWYPEIPDRVRIALLRFATAMGEPKPFDLAGLEAICTGAS